MNKASLFLDTDELKELTHRTQPGAQVRALRFMGVEHKVRADGTVAVLRGHVASIFGATSEQQTEPDLEPDWSAI